jgi:hypothetical protein
MNDEKTRDETISVSSEEKMLGMGMGTLVLNHSIDKLVGKLLTLAETLGLSEKQENSYKDLVRQTVYNYFGDFTNVEDDLTTLVYEITQRISDRQHELYMAQKPEDTKLSAVQHRAPMMERQYNYRVTATPKE